MKEPLVFIILVNYNSYEDTLECIESLHKISYLNYKVVVVDNASQNNSVKILKDSIPEVAMIVSESNLGFAGGNNLGIEFALQNKAEYVLLLNNDTLVEPDFLNKMIDTFKENKEIGAVGCKIKYYPDKNIIWYAGGEIKWNKFSTIHYGIGQPDNEKNNVQKEVDFITGCVILIKAEVIKKIGLLPEEYFMYCEDMDYSIKISENGYKMMYNPDGVVYHKVGFSSGGEKSPFSIRWGNRSRILFMDQFKSKVNPVKYRLLQWQFFCTRILIYVSFYLRNDRERATALAMGIREGLNYVKKKNQENTRS